MGRRRKREWFDDDAFWDVMYPIMFTEKRLAEAPEEMEKAVALAQPPGKAVLDLCCGPGRCSIALARAGFEVTGVDRTTLYLDKARAGAEEAGVDVEWVRMDMRDFVRPEAFDFVLSMFTSFGYFDDRDEDLDVLRNIVASLKPGGVFLVDLMGKEHLAKIFEAADCDVRPDGTTFVQRREVFDDWTRIRNEWILIREDRVKRHTFHHTVYSGLELRDRMSQAGFAEVKLYGDLDGGPYGLEAQRLIAVGRT